MKKIFFLAGAVLSFTWLIATETPAAANPAPYPEGFRSWVHVKTGIIGPQSKGFASSGGAHHIYANAPAMEGYRTGNWPDGSIIVYDLWELGDSNGNSPEVARRWIDVMVKDSVRYAETGGWGFEEFDKSSRTVRNIGATATTACYQCHTNRKANGYVFSAYRE